jgi:hypothetical protein
LPSLGSRSLNYSGTTCRSPDIESLTTVTLPSLGLLSEIKIRLAAKPGLQLAEKNKNIWHLVQTSPFAHLA